MPLPINGNTASLAVPWDTCLGGHDGYLSLPNPSLTSDAQVFVVSGSLTVDIDEDRNAAEARRSALDRRYRPSPSARSPRRSSSTARRSSACRRRAERCG